MKVARPLSLTQRSLVNSEDATQRKPLQFYGFEKNIDNVLKTMMNIFQGCSIAHME